MPPHYFQESSHNSFYLDLIKNMSLFTIDYEANGIGCIKNKVKEFLDGWYEVFDHDKEHRLEEVKLSGVLTGRIKSIKDIYLNQFGTRYQWDIMYVEVTRDEVDYRIKKETIKTTSIYDALDIDPYYVAWWLNYHKKIEVDNGLEFAIGWTRCPIYLNEIDKPLYSLFRKNEPLGSY